jgi:hypothetical protein
MRNPITHLHRDRSNSDYKSFQARECFHQRQTRQQANEFADFQGFVSNDDRNHAGADRLLLPAMVVKPHVHALLRSYVAQVSGWFLTFRAAHQVVIRG